MALGGVALTALFAATGVYGQGQYYPVDPAGPPYGTTYVGINTESDPDIFWLQAALKSLYPAPTYNVSLQVPLPTTVPPTTAPTSAQYAAAVAATIAPLAAGNPGSPTTISLASMVNESIAWRPADRALVAQAIAQSILQNSTSPAATITNLNTAIDALAKTQPALIDTIVPSFFGAVAASSDATVAASISQLVTTAVNAIPNDQSRIASIETAGLTKLGTSTLTAAQKSDAFNSMVTSLLSSTNATNNPVMIDTIVKTATYGGFSSMATLSQAVTTAVGALPTKSNATVGAVIDGALRSQGANAAAIGAAAAAANPATAAYTDAVVGGYSNSGTLTDFQNYVNANKASADAAASGAVVRGTLTSAVIVQWALRNGTANAQDVVAATIGANQTQASAVVIGAINTTAHTPWAGTFGDIAWGAAFASPGDQVGNVVAVILQNSSTGITALNTAVVSDIVTRAIQGAAFSNRPGSYADIVYKMETVARNTGGASAVLVVQAIDAIKAANGPSYLALVAALGGDVYGANRTAIRNAGLSELTNTGGDVTAGTNGANLVLVLQTNATLKYTNIVTAFKLGAALTPGTGNGQQYNTVVASLYAVAASDNADYAAALASAIKQSSVSPDTLTSIMMDAMQNPAQNANIQMAGDVASHFKAEALSNGIGDVMQYVSHQIQLAPASTQVIAYAATTIDPDNAHYIAHAVAFNSPTTVASSVASIFVAAQITNSSPVSAPTSANPNGEILGAKAAPGPIKGAVLDQPAVAAAITAALTTGILEANLSATDTKNALVSTVTAAVVASIQQQGVYLTGPLHPFFNSTVPGDSSAFFAQSNGNGGTVASYRSSGAAGAITGFVAQVTNAGDSTISDITKAVLGAAAAGAARYYGLDIAQAAAQALRWVGGTNVDAAMTNIVYTPGVVNSAYVGNPAYDIAIALQGTLSGFFTLAQLETAAAFGIAQAKQGTIGAGALGLNAVGINPGTGTLKVMSSGNANADFYQHRSAAGTPVTNIYNL